MEQARRTKHHDGGVWLPEDLVFEVLARLPAKALCRFRCVCKGWRALIASPAFVAAQRSRAGPHVVGVLYNACWPPKVRVMDLDGNVVRALEMVMRASTPLPTRPDLICVDGSHLSWQGGGMVIDPAAGRAFAVDFGGSNPPPTWGFTYSTSFGRAVPSGAFKFVHLKEALPGYDNGGSHTDVATIIGGGSSSEVPTKPTWRRRPAPPFLTGPGGSDHKAIVNGILYCISHELETAAGDNIHGYDDTAPCRSRIAAFDLESEEWRAEMMSGPTLSRPHKDEETWCIALVEIKGTLAMVDAHVDTDDMSIWLLVDADKSVWVKECTIQMPEKYAWSTNLLGSVLGDGRMLLLARRMEKDTGPNKNRCGFRDVLVFCNPSTKALTDLWRPASDLDIHWSFYTGSLLS